MDRRTSLGLIVSAGFGSGFGKNNPKSLLKEHAKLSKIEQIACRYFSLTTIWCNLTYTEERISDEDHQFMIRIERSLNVPEQMAADFRRNVAAFLGMLFMEQRELQWNSFSELVPAFEKELLG